MNVEPNGNDEYYQYLRRKDDRESVERAKDREHAERLKALEIDQDADAHRIHAERMKALEMGLNPASLPDSPTNFDQEEEKWKRELKHAERMKALEMGIDPYQSRWPVAFACSAIGAGVPLGVAFFLTIASNRPDFDSSNWILMAYVGLPAMIASTVLAWRGFGSKSGPIRSIEAPSMAGKPAPEPHVFDIAGHRN